MARRRSVDPYPQLASLERDLPTRGRAPLGRAALLRIRLIVFAGGKDGMAAAAGAIWLRPSAYRRMNHYLDIKQSPSVGGFKAIRPPARGQQFAFAPDVFAEFKAAAAATKNVIIDGDRRVAIPVLALSVTFRSIVPHGPSRRACRRFWRIDPNADYGSLGGLARHRVDTLECQWAGGCGSAKLL